MFNLEGFSCKNSLHTKDYTVKGMMTNKDESQISYLLLKNDGKKYMLNITLKPFVKIYNLIEVEEFGTGRVFSFVPEKFYKPLGFLKANFFIVRQNPKKLRTNMFILTEKENMEFEFVERDRFYELDEMSFLLHINDKIYVPDEVIVHNGRMHADDILSVALLKYINKDIKVTRTRDIPENFKGVVADVGGGRYDHHNLDKIRTDGEGNPLILPTGETEVYAAFGLLCKDILPGIIGIKNYFLLDHQIIRSLDSNDNYGTFSDLAYFFSLFNPAWNETKTEDQAFLEAVEYGLKFITELINKELARQSAMPYVQSKIAKTTDHILVLDARMPWQSLAKKSSIYFAVYPTDDNNYALQSTPKIDNDARTKLNKIDLPEKWIENKPKGCIFVHKNLFFATFDTKENAILAAKEAILNGKRN